MASWSSLYSNTFHIMDWSYGELGICIGSILIALYFYGTRTYGHFKKYGVKYFKPPLPYFGNFISMAFRAEHFRDFTLRLYNNFKDEKYIGIFEVQSPLVILRDPEIIKLLVIKDFEYFVNHRGPVTEDIDPIFGNAIANVKEEKWREMRPTLSPAFSSAKMKKMLIYMEEIAKNFADYFIVQATKEENGTVEIKLKDTITRYTNDAIATSIFGLKTNSLVNRDNEFYTLANNASKLSGMKVIIYGMSFYIPSILKFFNITFLSSKVISYYRNLVQTSIASREQSGMVRHDMINILMEAKKGSLKHEQNVKETYEAGFATVHESSLGKRVVTRKWTDDDLTAQAVIFLMAGFETTSYLILFILYEMACNPDVQEKLQNEIDSFITEWGDSVSYDNLKHLQYLDMILSETLRKWPPFLVLDRVCTKDYSLPPPNEKSTQRYPIKKGEGLWVPIYAIHHDPKYYQNPERFDPERFSNENKTSIKPGTYIPFGLGPRNCIGSRYALMVSKIIIFHLLAKFDITVTKNTQIPLKLSLKSISLLPEKELEIGLRHRNLLKT